MCLGEADAATRILIVELRIGDGTCARCVEVTLAESESETRSERNYAVCESG